MKSINIEKLLENGYVKEHYSYKDTGIVTGKCKRVSGTAGIDVDTFYIYPYESARKQVELVGNNGHYGYAHFGDDGMIYDNSNRAVFRIVSNSDIPEVTVDEIPENLIGFWEASEEEQKEIDDIISDLEIDFE